MNEEVLNLTQKLAKIRKLVEVLKKDKSGYSYKYVSAPEILAKLTGGMEKYHVSLRPSFVLNSEKVEPYSYVKTKTTRDGKVYEENVNEVMATAQVIYEWIDDDTGESIKVPWVVTGSQTDPSQALGGALTYSMRYFLLNFFQIATLDDSDPDAWRGKQKEAEAAEEKTVATQIINQVDSEVRIFMADNPDKAEDMKKFFARYAKGGNYKSVTDPKLAAKILEDFNNTFISKEE